MNMANRRRPAEVETQETANENERATKTFVAGGCVGSLHSRLQRELGLDWDDPVASMTD
jgi:hypothetical protein